MHNHHRTLAVQIVSTYYAPETTGNAPYLTSLARGLVAALGHNVRVSLGVPPNSGWRINPREQQAAEEAHDGVHVQCVASSLPARPAFLTRIVVSREERQ